MITCVFKYLENYIKREVYISVGHDMRVTPRPPFYGTQYSGFLDGRPTQYAKGRYAVRKNPVIYRTQTSFFTLKRYLFTKKHNKIDMKRQITPNVSRDRFARAFLVILAFF